MGYNSVADNTGLYHHCVAVLPPTSAKTRKTPRKFTYSSSMSSKVIGLGANRLNRKRIYSFLYLLSRIGQLLSRYWRI